MARRIDAKGNPHWGRERGASGGQSADLAEIDRLISSPDREKAIEQMNVVAGKLRDFGIL